ncbi:uncharacterized protein [Zea mays]|uniref:Uncharacterized protein n=1 Tax=Zea mays TaxID=4577 RepID=C0PK49_MAIZE|nr:uncharacterized protein LOC118473380 [Zea mays]ACN35565.1 unknown [Zea mays]|eukprot:XP_020399630.1 uncharacterized protein LOC100383934 [Zea mays]
MKVVKLNVFPPAPARASSSSSRYSSSSSSSVIFDVWRPLSYKLTKLCLIIPDAGTPRVQARHPCLCGVQVHQLDPVRPLRKFPLDLQSERLRGTRAEDDIGQIPEQMS